MKRCMLLVALVAIVVCTTTFADTVASEPSLTILWDNGSVSGTVTIGPEILTPYMKQNGSLTEINIDNSACDQIIQQVQAQNYVDLQSLKFSYDTDPYVTGGFSALNSTGSTQTYTFIFTSAVAPPITPTSLYGGSMSGSFTAGVSVPATVTTVAPAPLYWGIIDGTPVMPIYPDPTSWSVAGPFSSGDILPVNIPTTNVGPAVLNSISMQFKFTLTPDDTATMNGIFEVIPEPATLTILGLGGMALLRRRAR